ncbi:MAG: ferritin-like domain-containing protein [Chloroflexi bacterium]|nr:ferritin-like domain-containing protein [Chloroflexota bacterium]
MERQELIQRMNRALSLEYAGMIQYLQHSYLVQGLYREVFHDYFVEESEGNRKHAQRLGERIVALGGTPAVEPATIRQSMDLAEMLQQNLEIEREALRIYSELANAMGDNVPLRMFFEEMAFEEQDDVWELEKLLEQHKVAIQQKEIRVQRVAS